ncbi:Uncharacterized protein APZ42_033195, partial [Daphnia magna]
MADETFDQELPENDSETENAAQVETASGNVSICISDSDSSKVQLPSEFFENMGD